MFCNWNLGKRHGRICIASLLLILAAGLGAHAAQGLAKGIPDPGIIKSKEDGCYYIFSTGRGIPIHRSKDLLNWEPLGSVFQTRVPQWARTEVPGARNIWAPDISYFNGEYHLYYSISTFGSQRSCIGLATNKTLDPASEDYKWTDHGVTIESAPDKTNFNAIDPAAFVDTDGGVYLAFGSFWDGIKMVHIDPATGKPNPDDSRRYSLARRPQHHAIEAAFIILHNDCYYLFVSFDACCDGVRSTYRVMVGRSRKVTGPYIDIAGKRMTEGGGSLVLASHENWRGPGHNAVLQTPEGDFIVHHTYDARETRGGRNLQIRPLLWDDRAWPLAGEPLGAPLVEKAELKPSDLLGKWKHLVNYEVESTVTILPDGRLDHPDSDARWTLDGNNLIMHRPDKNAPNGAWLDELRVAPDGKSYIGRNLSGMVIRGTKRND
ncbi:MAG: arabinan endo-1,5-alpha-L-arabinosidase [Sedimentisphaerales bacterium]|nr:arabinan endo-1,5-alpha-L-arabinosidase [Sedimentisphaerales bacterium]